MSKDIIVSSYITSGAFVVRFDLVSYSHEGLTSFDDKWFRSKDGLIQGNSDKWDCTYYNIGSDVELEDAQKEFDRDCEAFDVHLFATVLLNGVVLLDDESIVGSDYHWSEDAGKLLSDLIWVNVNVENLADRAELKRINMLENLTL